MADREKVIKGLIACTSDNSQADDEWHDCENCPYAEDCATGNTGIGIPVMADALALLKEQEVQKFFVDESGKITPLPVVVRCKDCKHRPIKPNDYENGFDLEFPDNKCPCQNGDDGWYSWYPADNWYCAEGERKEDDG